MTQNSSPKTQLFALLVLLLSWNASCRKNISKIAFGFCSNQSNPLSIFDVIGKHKPDLFTFLGDNIYGDTDNMNIL